VPTTWDETIVVNGKVGDFITIARRSGEDWFIGSMTDWSPRTLEIPLDFLGDGQYHAIIWSDTPESGQHPERLAKSEMSMTGIDTHLAKLAPGGGQVMHLFPE